jgi:hypothetical protein
MIAVTAAVLYKDDKEELSGRRNPSGNLFSFIKCQ